MKIIVYSLVALAALITAASADAISRLSPEQAAQRCAEDRTIARLAEMARRSSVENIHDSVPMYEAKGIWEDVGRLTLQDADMLNCGKQTKD